MTTTILSVEEIIDLMDAITDPAAGDGRELTEQEVSDYTALEADLTKAQARRDQSEAVRKRHREYKERVTQPLHVGPVKKDDDELEAAFVAYLRTGKENADLQHLRAAQSEGTPSEGGFLVPDGFLQKIVARTKAFGGLDGVVDNITTDTGNFLPWLTEGDDTGNTGEQVDENGTMSGGADLSYGKKGLNAYSYMAGGTGGNPFRLPRELVQDAAFDIAGRVSNKLGMRIARKKAALLVSGTGVNQPQGIVTNVTGTQTAANNALTYADFLTWVHAVDPSYRDAGNCRWAFNDNFLKTLRGKLDTNGRPLLVDANAGIGAAPGGLSLLGYPVTIDQGFSDFNNASPTVNFGVFGDLYEGYIVRDVKSVEVLVNPYSRMSNRQIEYSAWFRFDAMIQNSYSYVALTGKT